MILINSFFPSIISNFRIKKPIPILSSINSFFQNYSFVIKKKPIFIHFMSDLSRPWQFSVPSQKKQILRHSILHHHREHRQHLHHQQTVQMTWDSQLHHILAATVSKTVLTLTINMASSRQPTRQLGKSEFFDFFNVKKTKTFYSKKIMMLPCILGMNK